MVYSRAFSRKGLFQQAFRGEFRLLLHEGVVHHEECLSRDAAGCSSSRYEVGIREVKNLHDLWQCIPEHRRIDAPPCPTKLITILCFGAGFHGVATESFIERAAYR